MKILVINAGSSSLKYQLIDMDTETVLCKGLCERIGIAGSVLTHKGPKQAVVQQDMKDHNDAIALVIAALTDADHGVVKSMDEINAVGHRVLHGGSQFFQSSLINDEVIKAIEDNCDLGPLHNPANLMGIRACMNAMPGVPQVAVFDTAFHQTMPPKAYLYGLPYEAYEQFKVRRYGFHGTSHRYVSQRASEIMGYEEGLKLITCHLGNGSSIAAIKDGKCVDTSMGLTPLEGLVMGTRCGDMDPAAIKFLMDKTGMTIEEMDTYINKKSGVLSISGVSSDFRDLAAAAEEGNERAELALEVFAYRIQKYIGSYAAAMGGVDCIVFTAGIGENDSATRARILKGMEWIGIDFDEEANKGRGEIEISRPGSKVRVLVIPTDEEMTIARDTKALC
ncbi:MAG: acetate kinase [Clostridia bacterium]|nr:acetate kinase [Clostridia bacterium]